MNGYIGKPLRRREDARFIQGRGRYVDDIHLPGTAWCAFVRSPHAHARIRSIATQAAAAHARRAARAHRRTTGSRPASAS